MKDYKFLIFAGENAFDKGAYCDFDTAASILAGKDILLAVWNSDGSKMLAISGQQNLTINRSAETIEINSKIVEGQDADSAGWKDSVMGLKEWSIDLDSLWVPTSDSHKALANAFDALLLERTVAHRQRFVNDEDFGLDGHSECEAETRPHAAGVRFHRLSLNTGFAAGAACHGGMELR